MLTFSRTYFLILPMIFLFSSCKNQQKPKANPNIPPKFVSNDEPAFEKEAELYFVSDEGKPKDTLNIQIADSREERMKGLMHYKELGENEGMLFIFEEEGRQSFWMKNTPISLDILFINEQKEIVDISFENKPYSLKSITSLEYALYVLEVNAGYCKNKNIEIGDKIIFEAF